jgi:hypothetical protein
MNPGYDAYINSPEWAAKRQERLALDNHRCRTCGHDGTLWRLEVHHVSYRGFGGDEDVENDLITLCASCHDAITNVIRSRKNEGRDYEVPTVSTTIILRQEYNTYGMADTTVSVDIIERRTVPQRADGKPAEQVGKIDETDFLQARQDRRRP